LAAEAPAVDPRRLGIYVDDVFRIDEDGAITVDRAFLLFACAVGERFAGCSLFGRTLHGGASDYRLPASVDLVALPHYPDLFHVGQVARSAPGTIRAMWRGLERVDVVWAFGPHPFAIALVLLAVLRRKRVVLGVRQDTLGYYRSRLPSRAWTPALAAVRGMDAVYRLLARRRPTTAVGEEIARHYGGGGPRVLDMTVSLVREAHVATEPGARHWQDRIELLTVGRVDTEKNPELVVELMRALQRAHPGRFRLTWAGRGPLEAETAGRAGALVDFRGYVPHGPELLALYREAHAFLHVSRTEGVPQVLIEALAAGLPVVATAVGGVEGLLDGGSAGVLVPPDDLQALLAAIERLAADPELRRRLALRGLEIARAHTMEAEVARTARFVAGS